MGCGLSFSRQDAHESNDQRDVDEETVEAMPAIPKHENVNVNSAVNFIPAGKIAEFGYSKDLKQRYRQGKLLGHGQFGYTYVATELSTGRMVAVKNISRSKMLRPIAVDDVKREVKIMKALSGHENVVQLYEAFEDDDYVYLVMELCEGGELLDRILARQAILHLGRAKLWKFQVTFSNDSTMFSFRIDKFGGFKETYHFNGMHSAIDRNVCVGARGKSDLTLKISDFWSWEHQARIYFDFYIVLD